MTHAHVPSMPPFERPPKRPTAPETALGAPDEQERLLGPDRGE